MKAARPRDLEWSWERSPGWRGQFHRVLRWHKRLLRQAGSSDLDQTFDVALAFFINCYHLHDWLGRSGEVSADDLDRLFTASLPLRVCADIANIAKHYDLTQAPRMTRQLSVAREYVPGGSGWFGTDGALKVLADGGTYDFLELASACRDAWTRFLEDRGLN